MSEYPEKHPLRQITRRPGASSDGANDEKKDTRASAKQAEYMELAGAVKDADCHKVKVEGGVSSKLGCCDYFKPENAKVQEFRCGECKFVRI